MEPDQIITEQEQTYQSPVNESFISELTKQLMTYTTGKKTMEARIIENDKWYKSLHWDIVRGKSKSVNDPEPVTAYLFSTIANKHADAMDYYPEPNILAREENDKEESQKLSKIVPVVLDKINYRKAYSDAWWYKLKQGGSATGVFWNTESENGLGDIDIQKLDLLNIYWEPGITNIQKSRYLFVVTLMDNDLISQAYPQTLDKLGGNGGLDVKQYVTDDSVDITNKSLLVDCYYKKQNPDGRMVVHLTKFVNSIALASTEDSEDTARSGLYDHGMYPVLLDVLFPEESTPVGFGYIDIIKNPQMYIDKLDQIIIRNSLIAGKQRTFIGDSLQINETELKDLSVDFVHFAGKMDAGSNYHVEQGKPLPSFIMQHRLNKITELKETSGTNDFGRGDIGGGITAAAAIEMIQEAGNKLSRDMIGESYSVYGQMIYMVIELIRQFYDEPRQFRILDEAGTEKYVSYTNQNLKPQEQPPAYEGEGMIQDPETGQMVKDPNHKPQYRAPVFDIKVKPEKANPFSRAAQNEMAKELFNLGFFNPQRAVEAKVALEMMSFEGKDKIYKVVAENGDLSQQLQEMQKQTQQMGQQMGQMEQVISRMNEVVKRTTGKDLMAPREQTPQGAQPGPEQQPAQGGIPR